jgi:hypothetical protein
LLSWATTSISPGRQRTAETPVAAVIAAHGVFLLEWITLSILGRVPDADMPYISREEVIWRNRTVLAVANRAITAITKDALAPVEASTTSASGARDWLSSSQPSALTLAIATAIYNAVVTAIATRIASGIDFVASLASSLRLAICSNLDWQRRPGWWPAATREYPLASLDNQPGQGISEILLWQ